MKEQLPIITRKFKDSLIRQRAVDGYLSATDMCKAVEKSFSDYRRSKASEEVVQSIISTTGIPASGLIQSVSESVSEFNGVWVQPQIGMHLARWGSPDLGKAASKWVTDWHQKMFGTMKNKSLNTDIPIKKIPKEDLKPASERISFGNAMKKIANAGKPIKKSS